MRILFDPGIIKSLSGHEVTEAIERGSDKISNGELLEELACCICLGRNGSAMWRMIGVLAEWNVTRRVKMKGRMPLLNWSPSALAVIRNKDQRKEMTRLFDAYFRVAGEKSHETLTGTILHLDLRTESKLDSVDAPHVGVAPPSGRPSPAAPLAQPDKNRYHFYAKFTKNDGWVVQAALKLEYRVMSKGAAGLLRFGAEAWLNGLTPNA
jgi:hypothetical protein